MSEFLTSLFYYSVLLGKYLKMYYVACCFYDANILRADRGWEVRQAESPY